MRNLILFGMQSGGDLFNISTKTLAGAEVGGLKSEVGGLMSEV
jgi:hypothetical protein